MIHLPLDMQIFKLAVASSVCGFFLSFGRSSEGETLVLDWFSLDGGGGTSTGGVYTVSGSIGQPDIGHLKGGKYSLVAGISGVVAAVQTPGAPGLQIKREAGFIAVFWQKSGEGYVLDHATELVEPMILWRQVSGPYQTNGSDISFMVPNPIGNEWYRLRKP